MSEGVCVDLAFFLMRPFHRVTVNRDLCASRIPEPEILYRADHIASQLQEALSSSTVTVLLNYRALNSELRRSPPRTKALFDWTEGILSDEDLLGVADA